MKKISLTNHSHHPPPRYESSGAAGADLRAFLPEEGLTLGPMARALVPTGLHLALPQGWEAQIRPRSGLAWRQGLTLLNSPGTIDSDYRGEIKILLINLSSESQVIKDGDRIAQMIISSYETVTWQLKTTLPTTERNEQGFGSTGKQ